MLPTQFHYLLPHCPQNLILCQTRKRSHLVVYVCEPFMCKRKCFLLVCLFAAARAGPSLPNSCSQHNYSSLHYLCHAARQSAVA